MSVTVLWNNEIVLLNKLDGFLKKPKKRYGIEDTNFNQFDFPKNNPILTFTQFKLAKNFKDKDEYTRLKIHFQAVLGKIK